MKTLNTAANAAAAPELYTILEKLGFAPARWDAEACRIYDLKNEAGFPIIRVAVHMSGGNAEYASVCAFNGTKAQLLQWEVDGIPPEMPLAAFLGIIKGAMQIA